jgi:hypothetical protein
VATYLENSVPSGGRNARRGVQFRLCMAGTASGDAAAVGTAPQNEWDVVDRTHHQLMTELGVLDKYVSPAMELASKKGVKARSKLRQHRREHNDREIRHALLANSGLQSALQPHVRAAAFVHHTSLCSPSRIPCPQVSQQ